MVIRRPFIAEVTKELLDYSRDIIVIVTTQITRIRNSDGSQTLKKQIDGGTLPYSEANLTTLLSGVTNPIYVLKRIDNNGNAYPFTLQARDPDMAFKL